MHDYRPTLVDFRRLAALAIPVALVQLGLMAMVVVDTMLVGRLSATDLAGVAVGSVYVFALGSFSMGILMSLDPLVSQAFGARDHDAIARAFQRGLVLAVGLGVLSGLVLLPVEPMLRLLRQPEALIAVATPYVRVQAPSMMGFTLFVALRLTLQAQGQMRPVMLTIITANVINLVLAWALVFGELGAPRLGSYGAGIATAIARWSLVLLMLGYGWRQLRPWFAWRSDTLQWGSILRMIWIGIPIGLQYELEYGVFAAVALVMGHLGPVPASAHQIAINFASLTFMVPLGISSAASILVGHAVGAGEPAMARRSALAGLCAGAGVMALSACLLVLLPRMIARMYTPDPVVVAMAATFIPIAGVFQIFDGIQVVSIGVLRGVGDTRTPLIVSLVGYWLIALPLALWLGFRANWGPQGLWWGLVAGLVVVALVLLLRVRTRLWGTLRRLEGAASGAPPATH